MNETNGNLETRVRRLERSNRLLMLACLALAGVPMLLAAGAQDQPKPKPLPPIGPVPAPGLGKIQISKEIQDMLQEDKKIHNVLRARVFELVDKNGKSKALISTDSQGNPMLLMFGVTGGGKQDYIALNLGLESNRPQCVLYDHQEKPKAGLYSAGDDRDHLPELLLSGGGRIHIKHENGADLALLKAQRDAVDLQFNTKEGKKIAVLNSNLQTAEGRTFRISEFRMWSSEKDNTVAMATGPTTASLGVSVGGTKYVAGMTAENFAIISARCNDPMSGRDQKFCSKWTHDEHTGRYTTAWLLGEKD